MARKHPHDLQFTWSNSSGSLRSRIDFLLISDSLSNFVNKVEILPSPLSDHKSIILAFDNPSSYSRTYNSYWKLNSVLLEDEEICRSVISRITTFFNKAQAEDNFGSNWELLKYNIRLILVKAGTQKAKQYKAEELDIVKIIVCLSCTPFENVSVDQKSELVELQNSLDNLYIRKAKGAFVRSRRRWLEEGECNSSYFFRLEKQRNNLNSISSLNVNRIVVKNYKEMSNYCEEFYKDLYRSRYSQQNLDLFFNSIDTDLIPKIDDIGKNLCDTPIQNRDISEAIDKVKLNKAPGNDGLTTEFYKKFSNYLSPFLYNVYLESLKKGILPPSMTQGVIHLIPKPQKDHSQLEN